MQNSSVGTEALKVIECVRFSAFVFDGAGEEYFGRNNGMKSDYIGEKSISPLIASRYV